MFYFFTRNGVEGEELLGRGTKGDDGENLGSELGFELPYGAQNLLLLPHLKL